MESGISVVILMTSMKTSNVSSDLSINSGIWALMHKSSVGSKTGPRGVCVDGSD